MKCRKRNLAAMDIQGHNHLPPELQPHDHDHGEGKPRWLPFTLGLLVILVAALALLNRERFVKPAAPVATETPAEQPAAASAPVVDQAPAVKPAPKPVVKPKPATTTTAKTASTTTGLHLAAAVTANGINLNWTASSIANFASYKIVRSADNPNPAYPADGYIRTQTDRSNTNYLDTGGERGRSYFYRICAIATDGKVSCGNVVELAGD